MNSELSEVVDALPGLVWTALPGGRVDFVNRGWREFTGLAIEAIEDGEWLCAGHPDDRSRLRGHWRTILDSDSPGEMEARLRRADGEYRWFLIRASPIAVADGRVVKWCGLGIDIDDRRRAEEVQRVREDRFRMIVDGFPAIVSLRTPDGDLEHVNRRFVEYSGTTLETLQERPWHDTWHPDDRPGASAAWAASLATGQPCNFEGRRRRADGVYRWFEMRGLPLRDAAGKVVLWYLLQTDIDDRRRAEALLASERRLLDMVARAQPLPGILEALCHDFENSSPGSFCSIVLASRNGANLEFGVGPSLPAGFLSSIVGRPIGVDSGPCAMATRLKQRVVVADLAEESRWATAMWRPMAVAHGLRSCWSTPIVSSAGNVLGTFTVYYDTPSSPTPTDLDLINQVARIASIAIERERSDEALADARSEVARVARVSTLGALTASIAHEVNQPLSGIITNASTCLRMLGADPPNVDGARETARRTIRDGNRAADVIARLRALFSKKDATSELLDLNQATREIIALYSRELQRDRIVLRTELAADLPVVTGDRIQLQQVILNLVMNATEAMIGIEDRPRVLSIKSEREEGNRVRLAVQDSGVGIDVPGSDRIFDAFYTTKSGGMGIGLSVSRSIVESHRGRLWAAPNERAGATFAFSLPGEAEHALDGGHRGVDCSPSTNAAAHSPGSP